jgi:hypothetical protein
MVEAVTEAKEKRMKYVQVECLNCRKQIKIPVSQMKRYVPESEKPADEDAS